MTQFLNTLRTIVLVVCVMGAIIAYGNDDGFAFSGWLVASLMTINSFEFKE